MREYCVLKHCEWANSSSGRCLWPGDWCPNAARRRREQLLERNRAAQDLAREKRRACAALARTARRKGTGRTRASGRDTNRHT